MTWGGEDQFFRSAWDGVLALLAMAVTVGIVFLFAYTIYGFMYDKFS